CILSHYHIIPTVYLHSACFYLASLSPVFFFFNDTPTTEIYTLSLHDALPILSTTLFVGTEKGLFALDSDDRRESWSLRGPMHKGWQVYSLRHVARDRTFWAGLSSRVYGAHLERSRDYGDNWEPVAGSPAFPEGSPRKLQQIWSLAPGQAEGSLLCGVAQAALFASGDGGQSWELN